MYVFLIFDSIAKCPPERVCPPFSVPVKEGSA